MIYLLQVLYKMPRTKKKSVCIRKRMPVLSDNDNSDIDTVDIYMLYIC